MARVNGIISAGLASAADFANKQVTHGDAVDLVAANTAARSGRIQAVDAGDLPPDWLSSGAAGLAAGLALGPAGGLLVAGITALASKSRREGIAAFADAESTTTEDIIERGELAVAAARERYADDEEVLANLDVVEQEAAQYRALMSSPYADERAQARIKYAETLGTLDAEAEEALDRMKAQREEDAARESREVSQFNTLQDDLRQLSGGYLGRREQWNTINQLAGEQNIANDTGLVYALLKMYDPQSTVMPGEQAQVSNAASVPEAIRAQYNKLILGDGTLPPDVRADFIRQADNLYRNSLEQQKALESQFIQKGRATGLKDDKLSVMGFTTPEESIAFGERDLAARARTEPPPPATPEESATETVVQPSLFARGVEGLLQEGVELVEEVGRIARGAQVIRRGDRYFEVEADGSEREIDPPQDFVPDSAQPRTLTPVEQLRRFPGARGTIQRPEND